MSLAGMGNPARDMQLLFELHTHTLTNAVCISQSVKGTINDHVTHTNILSTHTNQLPRTLESICHRRMPRQDAIYCHGSCIVKLIDFLVPR